MHKTHLMLGCLILPTFLFAMMACGDEPVTPDATPADAAITTGVVTVAWSAESMGNTIPCDKVGSAPVVRAEAFPVTGGPSVVEVFPCADSSGSFELEAGTWRITLGLQIVIGSLSDTQTKNAVEVIAGGKTDLGAVVFPVVTVGSMAFRITTNQVGANCESENNGAGITGIKITVHDNEGNCVAKDFTMETGTTYTNCSEEEHACIEADDTISMADMASGTYRLGVSGYKVGTLCYSKEVNFVVPAGGLVADLQMVQLMLDVATLACVVDDANPDAGM